MTLPSTVIRLTDTSHVGEARRAARRLADALGLGDVAAERAAIVATEAARNAVVHGGGGQIVLSPALGGRALDVVALDTGPGIADTARAARDGFSTAGTAGQGLGAIARLSAEFDLYSVRGQGTALAARIQEAPAERAVAHAAAISVAAPGETACGDAWAVAGPAGHPVVLVADGLGHGPLAAVAAGAAVAAFERNAGVSLPRLLDHVHAALRPTRGAAAAIAEATGIGEGLRYAGIGNISGSLVGSGRTRKMVSLSGTLGHEARAIRAFDYDWPGDDLLVMHSDGIATHWDLARYPGLALRHPALVAGILYRDFARGRDDATVVAVRKVVS